MEFELYESLAGWEMPEIIKEYRETKKINISYFKYVFNLLLEKAEIAKELLENGETLTDEEYYEKLKEFMRFYYSFNDYSKIVMMYFNAKGFNLTKTDIIRTTMHIDKKTAINYHVFCTEDVNIAPYHAYTISELQKLIDDKKIVLWYRDYRDIYEDTKDGLTQRDRKYFGDSVNFNIQRLRVEEEKKKYKRYSRDPIYRFDSNTRLYGPKIKMNPYAQENYQQFDCFDDGKCRDFFNEFITLKDLYPYTIKYTKEYLSNGEFENLLEKYLTKIEESLAFVCEKTMFVPECITDKCNEELKDYPEKIKKLRKEINFTK